MDALFLSVVWLQCAPLLSILRYVSRAYMQLPLAPIKSLENDSVSFGEVVMLE